MNKIIYCWLFMLLPTSFSLAQSHNYQRQDPKVAKLSDHSFVTVRIDKKSKMKTGIVFTRDTSSNTHAASLLLKNRKLTLQSSSQEASDQHAVSLSRHDFPVTLRLEKNEDQITAYYAPFGQPLQMLGQISSVQDQLVYGKVTGNNMTNIRFTQMAPAPEDNVDKNRVISRLEVLDIASGLSEVVYEEQRHFAAPNWSQTDSFFIINSNGLLYRLSRDSSQLTQIDTDFADQINNDHGISPDGTRLAVSQFFGDNRDTGGSTIFTLPIDGGKLSQVTPNAPSYWHGWSPDGKTLAYCAEREENFDIYTVPADGSSTENRLTIAEGLDDGPDYSPDGQYIYFNSERSGTMEIWRMKSDGNEQEQITDDQYQNWFPHPSPDGKWIIFLSFEPEVPSGKHPPNKKVMLRLLPVDGKGTPKVLAYLYGGQGTMNVPSWSPDSKKVVFVAYTYK